MKMETIGRVFIATLRIEALVCIVAFATGMRIA
jgi:hypothetical protein